MSGGLRRILGGARLRGWLWWGAGLLLTGYVFLAASLIIYRHPHRVDLTEEEVNTLSPETLNRLALLKDDVRVVLPLLVQQDDPLAEMRKTILLRGLALLDEYTARQPRIQLEAALNVFLERDLEAWNRICDRYQLPRSHTLYNRFIFLTSGGELRMTVDPEDLAVFDRPQGRFDRAKPQIRKFRGEAAFTAVLTRIIRREKKKVYAVEDHGESQSLDPQAEGLSSFREELEVNGCEVVPLRLRDEPRVPAGCDLLVMAGPEAAVGVAERQKLNDYLLSGGRLLVALGRAETGLESLIESFHIRAEKGQVLQRRRVGEVARWDPIVVAQDFNPLHPVTEQFRRGFFAVRFLNARALEITSEGGLSGEYLLLSPRNPESFLDRDRNRERDESEPIRPWKLAGAVWRPAPSRPPPGYQHVDVRILALGDVTPLQNRSLGLSSHREFLLNGVSWLLGREEQVAAGSVAWTERRLKSDPGIERFLFWVPVFLFPGIALCFGAFVFFLRRS